MITVCESVYETEESGEVKVYGLACGKERVESLSTCRQEMEKLAELCNRLGLSPVHLTDIALDYLNR